MTALEKDLLKIAQDKSKHTLARAQALKTLALVQIELWKKDYKLN